jgi:anhydro-N-acetylmuramic acid kinase
VVTALRTIGLISGTSMDGIDVAVTDLALDHDTVLLRPVGHTEVAYPEPVRSELLACLPPGDCTAEQLCRLDTVVGQIFANAAEDARAEFGGDLVGSLGQTIFHWVAGERCLGTLQIGQPAWIAERTGLPVVADLRTRDVAAGGHGAPLASRLDELWLATTDAPAAALNLGGIANITVVAPGAETIAYDTGPANALLDVAVRLGSHGTRHFDENGELAGSGTVRADLLAVLLDDPYYAAEPPKSTGKELFHADYLRDALRRVPEVSAPDLLATLVELTAATVAGACARHGVERVIASGGGVRNPVLMAAIDRRLGPAELVTSDELGLPTDAKEGYLTALLGFLTWHGIASNSPHATGAAGRRLLGSVTPGAGPLRLPDPVDRPVTRLRVTDTIN